MTRGQMVVLKAAMVWWRSLRPDGWNEAQHLREPDVHTTGERQKSLAHAVAMFIRSEPNTAARTRPNGQ